MEVTENPPPAPLKADVPFSIPAYVQLTDAKEVEACVASTSARPRRAQVVLQRSSRADQTNPPDSLPYIESEDYTIVDMLAVDFDHGKDMRVTKDGKRVGMPCSDVPFQRLIKNVVIRRDRQADMLLLIRLTYRKMFPHVIVQRDPLRSA